jgi:hypothetical protein
MSNFSFKKQLKVDQLKINNLSVKSKLDYKILDDLLDLWEIDKVNNISKIKKDVFLDSNLIVKENAKVCGASNLVGDVVMKKSAIVDGTTTLKGNTFIEGNSIITGEVDVNNDLKVYGVARSNGGFQAASLTFDDTQNINNDAANTTVTDFFTNLNLECTFPSVTAEECSILDTINNVSPPSCTTSSNTSETITVLLEYVKALCQKVEDLEQQVDDLAT